MTRGAGSGIALLLPAILVIALFVVLPILISLYLSFTTPGGYGLEAYHTFFAHGQYRLALWNAAYFSAISAVGSVALVFPACLYVSQHRGVVLHLFLGAPGVALAISGLIRTVSWQLLLSRSGIVDAIAQAVGLAHQPLDLLYSKVAVLPASIGTSEFIEFPPCGVTLDWYRQVANDSGWIASAGLSLRIAIITGIVTTLLAPMFGIVLFRKGHVPRWDVCLCQPERNAGNRGRFGDRHIRYAVRRLDLRFPPGAPAPPQEYRDRRMTRYTTLIDAAALHARIEAGAAFVVDCEFDLANPGAGRETYRAGHIPGAHYLHLDEDLSAPAGPQGRHPLPDPDRLAATLRAAGLRNGQQVVAYDGAGGPYAARLWWLLRWLGHDAVAVLDGGRQAWAQAGYSLETAMPAPQPGDFVAATPDGSHVVDADAVLANLTSGERLVIDARAPERFAGQPNPLDPVAGHIPGARNRFFKDNLGPDGRFLPAETLAAAFRAVLADTPADRAILQCGSGVTACHNALAMEVAGLSGAFLYPGSWSEWIADPVRPVESS